MSPDAPRFWFDFVDPCSFLVAIRLLEAEERSGVRAARVGIELVPPTEPPIRGDDPTWVARWEQASREAGELGVIITRPPLIPWTRKAHEMVLHSGGSGLTTAVCDAIFKAYYVDGEDIGRIDVLARIGAKVGLDPGETRTVLGVDRYVDEVRAFGEMAEREGVRGVPTLALGERRLEGLVPIEAIVELLTR